ncbi:hypothetical protein EG68_04472 [Paragonimus skrjabini miyazakii]|uniref:Transmembrane 9 superfamily member n=1 Tax=Paragonimus skrjabini miyazakii TaxID=59628 RepID=A0A8S9YRR0_9TREM|nr:hypothetical protein EG68_04472 [Paragonimus skrjabini miyazakii]
MDPVEMSLCWRLIFILSCCIWQTHAWHVPGVTPNEFKVGDPLEVRAVKLISSKTQLPFRYYDLDFCPPKTKLEFVAENIDDNEGVRYSYGFKLGVRLADVHYIYNHLRFRLQYNTVDKYVLLPSLSPYFSNMHRFVGFEVEPMSISETHLLMEEGNVCKRPTDPVPLSNWKAIDENTKTLQFSYEVVWESSPIRWASRLDIILKSQGGQVHWFSIINSLVIVIFLTTVISMILVRTLRRDIAKYNRDDDAEDILEESGWKLVHGDVFRPPRYVRLLTALFGSGLQIFCMVFVTILFATLGMLSPTARGTIMTAAIFTYVFMGLFPGYYAGRMYKTMRGLRWKSTAIMTGMLFPTLMLVIGFVLNGFILYKRSSAAVPFTTMLAIIALWLGVSLPLVFTGFYFGYRKRAYELPVRTNQIPRAVPQPKFHQNLFITCVTYFRLMVCSKCLVSLPSLTHLPGLSSRTLLAGALPFGAVFIEVFFVYMALWESRFYYLFGFLFAVFIILIICCAQVAIVITYFQLCNEDYRWWWRTFITSGGPAIYLLVYSVFYYWTKLNITQFVPTVVYFGYTSLMVITFWILTGTIGFAATFNFLRYIYAAIKID